MIKIIYSTYANSYLEQVPANATHLNAEERNQLLGILKGFEDLFGVTLGYCDTESVDF